MSFALRSSVLFLSVLSGCAGIVGEPTREDGAPITALDPDAGDAFGASSGGTSGASTGSTGGQAVNTGGASSGSTGSVGATTGGGSGGASSGSTAGASSGASNGSTAGSSSGGSSGGASTGSASGGNTTSGTPGGTSGQPATDPCGTGVEPLTTGLKIREIALYQAVKVPLMKSGTWVTSRVAPVVQGKQALVRVFVDTLSGFSSHTVRAVLTLDNAGVITRLNADVKPAGASTDAALGSTFNFKVSGADLGPSTKLSVSLVETTCPTTFGTAANARFPQTGFQNLDAKLIKKLRVVVVPIVIGGRAPDTSSAQLDTMRKAMLAHYPVPDVEITTRAPVTSGASVSANGGGWSDVLNTVIRTRQNDAPASDVYYYGIIAPAASFQNYCGFGCVLGLAPQTTRVSPSQQAGLGVGFLDERTPDTMVHELGHAHGRGHAPCAQGGNIDGVDQSFPDNRGGIVTWGWDSSADVLKDPSTHKDVMGYCSPTWISDYTYNALATRSLSVNTAARVWGRVSTTTWQGVLLYGDGTARFTGLSTQEDPGGVIETADVLDESGAVIDTTEVVLVPLSHSADSFLYLPKPEANWAGLRLAERTIWLFDIAAPL